MISSLLKLNTNQLKINWDKDENQIQDNFRNNVKDFLSNARNTQDEACVNTEVSSLPNDTPL